MELIVKSWVRYVVINHKCQSFSEGFLASSLVSAKAFQSYWGGEIIDANC
jgi:hypothetical protein